MIFAMGIIFQKDRVNYPFVIFAWIIFPVFVFSFFASKDIQFIYGVIPALAIGGAVVIVNSPWSKRSSAALTLLVLSLFLISTIQYLAVSFPSKTAGKAYLALPEFFRFANGQEYYGVIKSPQKELARALDSKFGEGKSGIVLFIPRSWSQRHQDCHRPTEFEIGGYIWMMPIQIHMDFLNNNLDYAVFHEDDFKDVSWSKEIGDSIILFELSPTEIEEFRKFRDRQDYRYINTFMSDALVNEFKEKLTGLPGKEIGRIPLFCQKFISVRLVSPKAGK